MIPRPSILLVEDSPGDARLVRQALSPAAVITHVTSLREATAHVVANEVDLVLLDLGLEDASGFEAIEGMRSVTQVPIVVLTGDGSYDTAMAALELGADDFVVKDEIHENTLPKTLRYTLEHRALQDRVRHSEETLRTVLRDVPAVIYTATGGIHGDLVFVSSQIQSILGFTAEEWIADPGLWARQLHPADAPMVHARETVLLREAKASLVALEYRMFRSDGEVVWIRDVARLVPGGAGGGTWHGVLLDITREVTAEAEHARARDDQRRTEELKDGIVASALDAIIAADSAGLVIEFNRAAEQIFGYPRAEALGRELAELLFPEQDRDEQRAAIRSAVGNPEVMKPRRMEADAHRADGSTFPAEVGMVAVDTAGDRIFIAYVRDLTQQKTLETQLRQSQKMEAVGQLAGGIAHDFNNLLAVILNYATFVSEDLGQDDPKQSDLEEITRAAELGGALTRQLLTFSRKEIRQPNILDINEIISGMERLLSRTIRESITLKTSLESGVWPIVADAGQLEQILVNLAVNANDAMPSGGTLSIETRRVSIDEYYASARPDLGVGEYTCLSISDSGCGMDEETRQRIFEPFFTTKPKDRGTGLGLATVYSIVKQSGGYVTCYSEEGVGTTFKLYFPRSTTERLTRPSALSSDPQLAGGQRILLVEDEDAVRKIGIRILEQAGYRVYPAASGDDALARFRDRQDSIDLLVTDVVMPGSVSGRALSEVLQVPTLFVSGYADSIIVETGGLSPGKGFLQKPFTAEALLGAVGDAIEAAESRVEDVG